MIQLISTDFDGTLIGGFPGGRCSPDLADALVKFKQTGGRWAINTGRDFTFALTGINLFAAPVAPDFLMTNERELYRWHDCGQWVDYGDWNERCRAVHEALYCDTAPFFQQCEARLREITGIELVYDSRGQFVSIAAATHAILDEAVALISEMIPAWQNLSFERSDFYLRFCHRDYHKGNSLAELCRLEKLRPEEVFATGDQPNDLPMLTPEVAAFLACPANAIESVQLAVARHGGFVAARSHGDGVADALKHFLKKHNKK